MPASGAQPPTLPVTELRRAQRTLLLRGDQARQLHHLHAVLLVALGHPPAQVARWLGCSPRSIERWVRNYRLGGCDALRVGHGAGRPARLSDAQWRELHADLAAPPAAAAGFSQAHWCGKLLAAHLQRRFGVAMGLRQCQRLLHTCPHV